MHTPFVQIYNDFIMMWYVVCQKKLMLAKLITVLTPQPCSYLPTKDEKIEMTILLENGDVQNLKPQEQNASMYSIHYEIMHRVFALTFCI
jgi:hypothetical protein